MIDLFQPVKIGNLEVSNRFVRSVTGDEARISQARRELGDVYGWFTGGIETPDMVKAASLLSRSNSVLNLPVPAYFRSQKPIPGACS